MGSKVSEVSSLILSKINIRMDFETFQHQSNEKLWFHKWICEEMCTVM